MSSFTDYCLGCSQAFDADSSALAYCSASCKTQAEAAAVASLGVILNLDAPASEVSKLKRPETRQLAGPSRQLARDSSVPKTRSPPLLLRRPPLSSRHTSKGTADCTTVYVAEPTMGEEAGMALWDDLEQDLSQDHDALYREHYPKFVQRRPTNAPKAVGTSPRSPYNSSNIRAGNFGNKGPPSSTSTLSSVMLLTPPPLLRRVTLPTPRLVGIDASDIGNDATILPPPPCSTFSTLSASTSVKQYAVIHSPESSSTTQSLLLQHSPSDYRHRSPFSHISERQSAPKRPLDLSQPGTAWLPFPHTPSSRLSQETVAPLAPNNSLGLEIQHIEDVPSPITPPFHEGDENCSPVQSNSYKGVTLKVKQNAISPLAGRASRSPLTTIQIPHIMAGMDLCDEGIRSVEAARYELGKEEANYIARKLAEEQKKRQAKERAAREQDPFETRGRSRAKKRAASYSSGSILG